MLQLQRSSAGEAEGAVSSLQQRDEGGFVCCATDRPLATEQQRKFFNISVNAQPIEVPLVPFSGL